MSTTFKLGYAATTAFWSILPSRLGGSAVVPPPELPDRIFATSPGLPLLLHAMTTLLDESPVAVMVDAEEAFEDVCCPLRARGSPLPPALRRALPPQPPPVAIFCGEAFGGGMADIVRAARDNDPLTIPHSSSSSSPTAPAVSSPPAPAFCLASRIAKSCSYFSTRLWT
jgi:hypothetical protein